MSCQGHLEMEQVEGAVGAQREGESDHLHYE